MALPDIASIRAGAKTRLLTITGWEVYDRPVGSIVAKCFVIGPVEGLSYDEAFGGGVDHLTLPVRAFIGGVDDFSGWEELDDLMAGTGSDSVRAAIDGDVTLGGVVDTSTIAGVRNSGQYRVGTTDYLGCEFLLEVWA